MTSETRRKSNRANAMKSSGPRSARGKAAVSGNALRHGILSQHLIVAGERQADFDALLGQLLQELEPVGLIEMTLVERIAVAIWRQRPLVRAEAAEIALVNADRSEKTAAQLAPLLGREWNDKIVRSVLAEAPGYQPDHTPDEVQAELAVWRAALESGIKDLDQLKEKFPLPYQALCSLAGPQGPAVYLPGHYSSLPEFLINYLRKVESLLAAFEVRRVVALYRESRTLPAAPDVIARYQSALDNELYKALRALRDAQSWRFSRLPVVT